MSKRLELTGSRFGRLTVSGFAYVKSRRAYWNCVCDCGAVRVVASATLVIGNTKSCGCLGRENLKASNLIHGMSKTAEHKTWSGIIKRCENPKGKYWKNYGGRGIKICERWRNSFLNFYADMGPRPSPQHSIDRFPNNDGNYEPENCRWA